MKHETIDLVIRKAAIEVSGHSAILDKTKYNPEGNADSLRVAKKSCNKRNYKYDSK